MIEILRLFSLTISLHFISLIFLQFFTCLLYSLSSLLSYYIVFAYYNHFLSLLFISSLFHFLHSTFSLLFFCCTQLFSDFCTPLPIYFFLHFLCLLYNRTFYVYSNFSVHFLATCSLIFSHSIFSSQLLFITEVTEIELS